MALFKIFKGKESNLPAKTNEGYAYFTTDEGNFFIDVATGTYSSHSNAIEKKARI
jgi:ribose 5-phosphate isomerase